MRDLITRANRNFAALLGVAVCGVLFMGADSRRALDLAVDGRSTGNIAAITVDGRLMVAIEGIAPRVGIGIRRADKAVFLGAEAAPLTLTEGDVAVRQGDAELWRLHATPRVEGGQFFVEVADLARLFNLGVHVEGAKLVLESRRAAHASPSSFDIRAYSDSGTRSLNANFRTNKLVTYLSVRGSRAGTSIGGSARITARDRQVTLGQVGDPLRGIVFAGQRSNGVAVRLASGSSISTSLGARDMRRSFALAQKRGDFERDLVVSGRHGRFDEMLLGLRKTSAFNNGKLEREAWIGNRGLAAGVDYRTDGRLFAEFRAGFAGAGLPLGPADGPLRMDMGYDLTSALTLRTGFVRARGLAPSSYFEIDARYNAAALSLSRSSGYTDLNLSLDSSRSNATFSLFTGRGATSIGGQGVTALGLGLLKFESNFDSNSHDAAAEFQLKRAGLSPVLGLEHIASDGTSRFGPALGLSYPAGKGLDINIDLRPTMQGSALRLSVNKLPLGSR